MGKIKKLTNSQIDSTEIQGYNGYTPQDIAEDVFKNPENYNPELGAIQLSTPEEVLACYKHAIAFQSKAIEYSFHKGHFCLQVGVLDDNCEPLTIYYTNQHFDADLAKAVSFINNPLGQSHQWIWDHSMIYVYLPECAVSYIIQALVTSYSGDGVPDITKIDKEAVCASELGKRAGKDPVAPKGFFFYLLPQKTTPDELPF